MQVDESGRGEWPVVGFGTAGFSPNC